MAANLSKVAVMGSCINGHVVQNDSAMSEPITGQEKVAILDAGAQYGKVRSPLLCSRNDQQLCLS